MICSIGSWSDTLSSADVLSLWHICDFQYEHKHRHHVKRERVWHLDGPAWFVLVELWQKLSLWRYRLQDEVMKAHKLQWWFLKGSLQESSNRLFLLFTSSDSFLTLRSKVILQVDVFLLPFCFLTCRETTSTRYARFYTLCYTDCIKSLIFYLWF